MLLIFGSKTISIFYVITFQIKKIVPKIDRRRDSLHPDTRRHSVKIEVKDTNGSASSLRSSRFTTKVFPVYPIQIANQFWRAFRFNPHFARFSNIDISPNQLSIKVPSNRNNSQVEIPVYLFFHTLHPNPFVLFQM